MGRRLYITDKEVAAVMEISEKTLSRILHGFHRDGKRETAGVRIDLAAANPRIVGGYRRWSVSSLASVLGMTEEQILARLA